MLDNFWIRPDPLSSVSSTGARKETAHSKGHARNYTTQAVGTVRHKHATTVGMISSTWSSVSHSNKTLACQHEIFIQPHRSECLGLCFMHDRFEEKSQMQIYINAKKNSVMAVKTAN